MYDCFVHLQGRRASEASNKQDTSSLQQHPPHDQWRRNSVHQSVKYFFIIIILSGVGLSPLGTAATTGLLYQPQMIDGGDRRAIGGMKIGRGSRSTRRKHALVPPRPPQIPQELTWDGTRAAAVGSRRLTAWAMARRCNSDNGPMKLHSSMGDGLLTALIHVCGKLLLCERQPWVS
jgi:hypothetical protein